MTFLEYQQLPQAQQPISGHAGANSALHSLHILLVKYNQQDKVYTGANALKDEDLDGSQIVQKCKDFFFIYRSMGSGTHPRCLTNSTYTSHTLKHREREENM